MPLQSSVIEPMVPIQKGPLIGKGLTSEVYAWGGDRVLKLFEDWACGERVEREYQITRALHRAGLPVPLPYEICEVGGRRGIIFERVDGHSMLKRVERKPWTLFAAAKQLAELHARIHSFEAPPELPSQKEQIERWISAAADFSEQQKFEARRTLKGLPAGDAVCHGDFHPENILRSNKSSIIIDWTTGTRGHPLGDVARTSLLFSTAALPTGTPIQIRILFKISRTLLHSTYLRRYLQLRPASMAEITAWYPPLRAAASAWQATRML